LRFETLVLPTTIKRAWSGIALAVASCLPVSSHRYAADEGWAMTSAVASTRTRVRGGVRCGDVARARCGVVAPTTSLLQAVSSG